MVEMVLAVNTSAAVVVLLLLLLVVRRVHAVDGRRGPAHGARRSAPSRGRRVRRDRRRRRVALRPRLRRLRTDDGRDSGRVRLAPDVLRVGQLVVLFVLHPSVLEPDFDLPF